MKNLIVLLSLLSFNLYLCAQEIDNYSTGSIEKRSIIVTESLPDSIVMLIYKQTEDIWLRRMKKAFDYDVYGNNTWDATYTWDNTLEEWRGSRSQRFEYEIDGRRKSNISEKWNPADNDWINYRKRESYLVEDSVIARDIDFNWNAEKNSWNELRMTTAMVRGNDTIGYSYNWNVDKNMWDCSQIRNSEIIDGVLTITFSDFNSDSGKFMQSSKTVLFKDSLNSDVTIDYKWDGENKEWCGFKKVLSSDISDSGLEFSEMYMWDSTTKDWRKNNRFEAVWNSQGELESSSMLYPDADGWIYYSKDEYSYDNGKMTEAVSSVYERLTNGEGHKWMPKLKEEHIYSKGRVDTIYNYSWSAQASLWEITSKDIYYYNDVIIDKVEEEECQGVMVYPNPIMKDVRFKVLAHAADSEMVLLLFNSTGANVLTQNVVDGEILNLEALAKGIYFYNLKIDNKVYSGKLIKE